MFGYVNSIKLMCNDVNSIELTCNGVVENTPVEAEISRDQED